ncbi:MAG: hypothetical protein M3441_10155 [Chloroflexota bacterium]|nr:hypothetical protein [Chloroflexota bacterium]
MTATATQTDQHVRYFNSPVRITTKAVELRDRLLPLEDVESAVMAAINSLVPRSDSRDRRTV